MWVQGYWLIFIEMVKIKPFWVIFDRFRLSLRVLWSKTGLLRFSSRFCVYLR